MQLQGQFVQQTANCTCAQRGICLAPCRGAGHHLAGDVTILPVICTGSRLTWLGQTRQHPLGTCCVAGAICQVEGGRQDGGVEYNLRSGILDVARACQAYAVQTTSTCSKQSIVCPRTMSQVLSLYGSNHA